MGFLFIELEPKEVEVKVLTNKEYEVFFPSVLHRTETQIFSKLIDKIFSPSLLHAIEAYLNNMKG